MTNDGQTAPGGDPRLRLVYEEARRGITRQEATLDEFRSRVSATLATTVIATAFFAPIVIGKRSIRGLDWWALGLFIFALLAQIALLVPVGSWKFRFSATAVIRDYVEDPDEPATLDEMYRDLALHLDDDFKWNEGRLTCMWWTFSAACLLLMAELLLWLIALIVH